jgi:hypothetical protein
MKRQEIAAVCPEAAKVDATQQPGHAEACWKQKIVPGKIDFVAVDNDFVMMASESD